MRAGTGAASRHVVAIRAALTGIVTVIAPNTGTVVSFTTNLLDRLAIVKAGRGIVRRLGSREINANFAFVQLEAVGLETGQFGVLLALKVNEPESL